MWAAGSAVSVLSGCSLSSLAANDDTAVSATAQPSSRVTPLPVSIGPVRIELHFGDEQATAVLATTPAAREFAAMLPLQLNLRDPMGQAKSGKLPGPLDVSGVGAVFDPAAGHIYYWAPSDTLAIFYEDFGHTVPAPGLVPLGAVDSGIDELAGAGNRFTVRIDFADDTTF
jgi:hypothetical protein